MPTLTHQTLFNLIAVERLIGIDQPKRQAIVIRDTLYLTDADDVVLFCARIMELSLQLFPPSDSVFAPPQSRDGLEKVR